MVDLQKPSVVMNESIQVQEVPSCLLCNSKGVFLYQCLQDRLFDSPGKWALKKCPSRECGLLWLDPMPLAEDINKFYQNYITHQGQGPALSTRNVPLSPKKRLKPIYRKVKEGYLMRKYGYYANSLTTWKKLLGLLMYIHPDLHASLDFSVMYLLAHPDGRLLDVGCGSGWLLKLMQDLGWCVEGIDFDPAAIENAKNIGLKVNLGTLESQKYPGNYFDAITLSHVIEHIHNPFQLLCECWRILKPGGLLVVVTPNARSFGHRVFKEAWLHLDPPRHLYIFTVSSLRNLANKACFRTVELSTTIRDANVLFMASHSIQHVGKHVWHKLQPVKIQIWARAMQLVEWAILKGKQDLGEEIAMVGKKE